MSLSDDAVAERVQSDLRHPAVQAVMRATELYGERAWRCVEHLIRMDEARFAEKGKRMGADHFKQEAVKWVRANVDK